MLQTESSLAASLLLYLFLSTTLPVQVCAEYMKSDDVRPEAECSPKEPLVASGSALLLNCTLTRTPPGTTAHSVVCKFANELLETVVLNSSTFQIVRENMTRQMSQGHVFCQMNITGTLVPLLQVVIRVADIPTPPNITGCVVYNWDKMVCHWEESPDTGLPTNYTLGWTLICGGSYYKCPHPRLNTCTWIALDGKNGFRNMPYCLMTTARNQLATTSSFLRVDPGGVVKPNPVHNISASNITSRLVTLSWIWDPFHHRDLFFRLNYSSQWEKDRIMTKETVNTSIDLENLVPFTWYNVSIDCKSFEGALVRGFWSNETTLTFRTADDVPAEAPAVPVGGFYVDKANNSVKNVLVFWQPLQNKSLQGPLVGFRIRSFFPNGRRLEEHLENVSRSVPYMSRLNVPVDTDVDVTVEAMTRKGCNESLKLNSVFIPKSTPGKPQFFFAVGHESELNITTYWSPVVNATGYTVYWCRKDLTGDCRTALVWTSLPESATNVTMSVESAKYNEFRVAVSVETYSDTLRRVISSGMEWVDCVHDVTKNVQMPEKLVLTKDQEAYSLSVEWQRPECHKTSYITGYELLYCQKHSCDRQVCCAVNKTMKVANNVTKATIRDLDAETEYEVWIRSLSMTSVSEFTSPLSHVVHRKGLAGRHIAGIVIAAIFLFILLWAGLITIAKRIKKCLNCCVEIKIVPPPTVVMRHDQNKTSACYNQMELRNEEQTSLLTENGVAKTQESRLLETLPLYHNEDNIHQPRKELSELLVDKDYSRSGFSDSGVPRSNDSSISPYTHLAVPDESSGKRSADDSSGNGKVSSDFDVRILPLIVSDDPSSTSPGVLPPVLEDASTNPTKPFMPGERIPVSEGSSLSDITSYTTVEQILPVTVLANNRFTDGPYQPTGVLPETEVCPNGQCKTDRGSDVSETGVCPNGQCKTDQGSGVSEILGEDHQTSVVDSKGAYSSHYQLNDKDSLKDHNTESLSSPPSNPSLPVGYIALAPTISR